jgi:hypothetical protein
METVSNSAHPDCSRMAACGEGNGPCVVHLRAENGRLQERVEEAEQERDAAKGLPTDSEVCQSCGSAVALVWAARDQDWLMVVGHPGGLLCPKCFAEKAWQHHGISLAFLAVPLEDGWSTEWYRLEAWIAAKCTIAGCWKSLALESR